jgi:hypothetical protein
MDWIRASARCVGMACVEGAALAILSQVIYTTFDPSRKLPAFSDQRACLLCSLRSGNEKADDMVSILRHRTTSEPWHPKGGWVMLRNLTHESAAMARCQPVRWD